MSQINEIDIVQMIRSHGGEDFLINLSYPQMKGESMKDLMIRNGIVIMLCKAESGAATIDGKEYRFSQNNVVVLPENHIINNIEPVLLKEWNIIAVSMDYILNLPSPIDTNIFSYSRYISIIEVTDEKFEDLMTYYRFIYKESCEPGRYQKEIISSIFYALILEILAEYENLFEADRSTDIRNDSLSDRFFRLLALHCKEERTVQFYASRLCLTPKYLSAAIKRATGRPILDWIHEAVLIDAKMLLRSTDMTVQEISEYLNFSSPSAFIQFFRKHTGTTPKKLLNCQENS